MKLDSYENYCWKGREGVTQLLRWLILKSVCISSAQMILKLKRSNWYTVFCFIPRPCPLHRNYVWNRNFIFQMWISTFLAENMPLSPEYIFHSSVWTFITGRRWYCQISCSLSWYQSCRSFRLVIAILKFLSHRLNKYLNLNCYIVVTIFGDPSISYVRGFPSFAT